MKLFPIHQENNTHVVDSRLIAQSLGLNHSNWMTNVFKKYSQVLENQFGKSILKMENPKGKGGRPVKYVYLTEDQAIFLATLSRNTERVIAFKVKLVKSFMAARHQQLPAAPPQNLEFKRLRSEMERMKLDMDILKINMRETARATYGTFRFGQDSTFFKELKFKSARN